MAFKEAYEASPTHHFLHACNALSLLPAPDKLPPLHRYASMNVDIH